MRTPALPETLSLLIEGSFIYGKAWDFTVPNGWRLLRVDGGILVFIKSPCGLKVGCSCAEYNGIETIHASCSREDRMPDYDDLVTLKKVCFGPSRYAAMILPPASEHVNIHNHCLHLWGPKDPNNWPFPAYGAGGTI